MIFSYEITYDYLWKGELRHGSVICQPYDVKGQLAFIQDRMKAFNVKVIMYLPD